MFTAHRDGTRLICPNESCINKSIVWRKVDYMREYFCKLCGELLIVPRRPNQLKSKQNQVAKRDLKVFTTAENKE